MNLHIKGMLILCVLAILPGCAFTNDHVSFRHNSSKLNVTEAGVGKSVEVLKLNDARGVEPTLLSYKGTSMKTGGQYLNDEEVSNLVTISLKDLLQRMGYDLSGTSHLKLQGEILRFDSNVIMGFWSGSIEATIQVNLKLVNNRSDSIVWSETIGGYGKKSGVQVDRWGNRELALQMAFDSLMSNIANSESLISAIGKHQ